MVRRAACLPAERLRHGLERGLVDEAAEPEAKLPQTRELVNVEPRAVGRDGEDVGRRGERRRADLVHQLVDNRQGHSLVEPLLLDAQVRDTRRHVGERAGCCDREGEAGPM
jgi:hypothetical protein